MLNEVLETFLGVRWDVTYIFAPQCPNLHTQGHIFVSGGGNHAEDNMVAQCGLPTEFYLTSAPSPDRAMMLYDAYKTKYYKPLIHIARPYPGRGLKEGSQASINKKVNLHCLAMLIEAGFTIVPWSWVNFERNYITNDDCKEAISKMTSDLDWYNMGYSKTMAALRRVVDMMMGNHDHNNYKICSDAANVVNNERCTANIERNVNNERYAKFNNARFAANNERYTASATERCHFLYK